MARGNNIIVSAEPRGVFKEGIISGTPKPGTLMQIKAGVAIASGRFTWEVFAPSGGDGKPGLIAVLLEDELQGGDATLAYTSGRRGRIYCPVAGEEINVRVGEAGGTANTVTFADLLMADAEDGILVPNSSGVSVPFTVMETETQVTDGTLVWCMYTGH